MTKKKRRRRCSSEERARAGGFALDGSPTPTGVADSPPSCPNRRRSESQSFTNHPRLGPAPFRVARPEPRPPRTRQGVELRGPNGSNGSQNIGICKENTPSHRQVDATGVQVHLKPGKKKKNSVKKKNPVSGPLDTN